MLPQVALLIQLPRGFVQSTGLFCVVRGTGYFSCIHTPLQEFIFLFYLYLSYFPFCIFFFILFLFVFSVCAHFISLLPLLNSLIPSLLFIFFSALPIIEVRKAINLTEGIS